MANFYVYAYLRRSDGTPYYIGKGKDFRYREKHGVSVPKDRTKIVFLETNLTEVGAFALERRMIRWYGRKDLGTGILRNMTDGGEGSSGRVFSHSDDTKRKISEVKKGRKSYIRSDETKKKNGLANSGDKNGMFGRKQPAGCFKSGGIPWNKGKKRTTINPLAGKPQNQITCPYCSKSGGNSVMKRHHFERCKSKPNGNIFLD